MIELKKILSPLIRFFMIVLAASLMSMNINTFVHSAGLVPGGFTGVVILVQEILLKYLGIEIPFSLFYWLINAIPAFISFRFIGKKFTLYSCLMILLSGLFTDLFPGFYVTEDILLCAIFGGIINGFAVTLCLSAGATSGGTDFIAIFAAERTGRNVWNFIFAGNCVVLAVSGFLFGWNSALYSIIFQFTSTQILNTLYRRYSKTTLFIITDKTDEVYALIKSMTNHDATMFVGKGCYKGAERKMLYTVVSGEQAQRLARHIREIDSGAFINLFQTKEIVGRFFQQAKD